MEECLKNKYFENIEIFNLRKSWSEKYYSSMKITYSAFTIVFFIPIIIFPIYLFTEGALKYGIALSAIMILILIIYSLLVYKIYENAKKNEA